MNVYIYDNYVTEKKYSKIINKIEIRITDLGLSGKIIRLESIKDIRSILTGEIRRGAKTIVAVGNDATVSKIINVFYSLFNEPDHTPISTLGIIPVGEKNNSIAHAFGIDNEMDACDILLARRTKKLDLGVANNQCFLTQASINTINTTLEINTDYSLQIIKPGQIHIINLSTFTNLPSHIKPNPSDGKLELFIQSGKKLSNIKDFSVIPFDKLYISNKDHPLVLDNNLLITGKIQINIKTGAIPIIVGKDRNFS